MNTMREGNTCRYWQKTGPDGGFRCEKLKADVICPRGQLTYPCWEPKSSSKTARGGRRPREEEPARQLRLLWSARASQSIGEPPQLGSGHHCTAKNT